MPLPTPGGGPIAAQTGAIGVGLFEMAASISARNPRTNDAAKARLDAACEKLAGLRAELLLLAQDDVHRYCALLSGVYEQKGAEKQAKVALWTHKCAETPMLVVKNAVAALNIIARPDGAAALVSSFTRSVEGDWLAGLELLRGAMATSVKNARINLEPRGGKALSAEAKQLLEQVALLEREWSSSTFLLDALGD